MMLMSTPRISAAPTQRKNSHADIVARVATELLVNISAESPFS
jgi:hypothetical protein